MPIPQTYYLDAATLSAATCIYLDVQLTTCAPNGFYSDSLVTREMLNCVLLPAQECLTCGTPCDESIVNDGSTASSSITMINLNTGTGVGAIILRLRTNGEPNGIKAIYNAQVYNKLSSPVDGVHESTDPIGYTFVGQSSLDCGISGVTYPALPYYIYKLGSFELQPSTQSITVSAGDVSLSASDPDYLTMVIPKIYATPQNVNVYVVGLCNSDTWSLDVICPDGLLSIPSTEVKANCELACSGSMNQMYYFASVSLATNLDIYDFVFYDAFGQNALADGFYGIQNGSTLQCMQVQNGVVIALSTCTNCIDVYITNVTTETGVNSIRFEYLDCDDNPIMTSPVGPGSSICIQTSLSNFLAMTYQWADAHVPAPTPADFTAVINGCL